MTVAFMEELLLAMAGHPTSLFVVTSLPGKQPWSWTLRAAETGLQNDHAQSTHPGLVSILDALADMAAKYTRIRAFAMSVQEEARRHVLRMARDRSRASDGQNSILPRMAACMLRLLQAYQTLIEDTERDIMHGSWDMITPDAMLAAGANVTSPSDMTITLISLRARFERWKAPLHALDTLVSQLLLGSLEQPSTETDHVDKHEPSPPPRCPRWQSGPLLDLLMRSKEASVGQAHDCLSELLRTAEDVWRQGLVAWTCYGTPRLDMDADANSADVSLVEWAGNTDPQAQAESLSASVAASSHLPKVAVAHNDGDDLIQRGAGWRFVPNVLPSWIEADAGTANAILHAGRALARVREHSKRTSSSAAWHDGSSAPSHGLPAALTAAHVFIVQSDDVRPCSRPYEFAKAMRRICDEVAEWMWRHILTPNVVLNAFDTLGDYFLHRNGLFCTTFLQRLTDVRKAKLVSARSAATSVMQVADLELAIQRALIDVESDDDAQNHLLDHCSVSVPHARPNARRNEDDWKETGPASASAPVHFDDIAIGLPFTLRYRAPFPLDMILTPLELRAYSSLFSYLLALQAVRAQLRDGWATLSKSQRSRRRFTGIGEGGDTRQEVRRRANLWRMACGLAREGAWFLDVLAGHFQTDVIDVQFGRLLERLDTLRPAKSAREPTIPIPTVTVASVNSSVDGWRQKVEQTVRRASSMRVLRERDETDEVKDGDGDAHSMAGTMTPPRGLHARATLARRSLANLQQERLSASVASGSVVNEAKPTLAPLFAPLSTSPGLDFATTRQTHQAFLACVLEGLLLTNAEACQCVWRILQTCMRFTALLNRWGGDVLPDLLSGSIGGAGLDRTTDTLQERTDQIAELSSVLRAHLDRFFVILSKASDLESAERSPQQKDSPPQVGSEAQNAATRHHEQLLLRLDFNHFISERFTAESDAKSNE